jgi:hypothetical protein
MKYKTIILELLQQRPEMLGELRKDRKLLPTLELYARELKTSHEAWKEVLSQAKPGSDPSRIVCPPNLLGRTRKHYRSTEQWPLSAVTPRAPEGIPQPADAV